MRSHFLYPVGLALLLTIGCVKANVESVVDKSSAWKIDSLLIVADGPSKDLTKKFAKILSSKFADFKIANEYKVISLSKPRQLSLETNADPDPIVDVIAKSEKQFILISNMTRVTTANGIASSIEMEMIVYSKAANKIIWKSQVTTGSGWSSLGSETILLNDIVEKTVLKIHADDLF